MSTYVYPNFFATPLATVDLTAALKEAYDKAVGHKSGSGQIYFVLHRHGWSKKMPRSKHPQKASDEAIEASKKLTQQ